MLPRLEAEEAMGATTTVGVGTGSVSPDVARHATRAWREAAGRRPPSPAVTMAALPALGIAVQRVPVRRPA